ncbi:hypothetical protein HMPREF0185_01508 [Brevundimonas diminuta 470-4]|nr:hypothetical protein HMPREF0185_01508 [Brevundimonas diminuta 470-4]
MERICFRLVMGVSLWNSGAREKISEPASYRDFAPNASLARDHAGAGAFLGPGAL